MWYSGFILGLLGSFHCVGMCGPIAMALPLPDQSSSTKIIGTFLYNFARAITYALLGIVFGLFGKSFSMIGWQQYLSIALGVLIIMYLILPTVYSKINLQISFVDKIISFIKKKIAHQFSKKNYNSLFTIGLLNGLLPCGFVYVGIAGAIAFAHPVESGLFMFMFGMGTFPIMFAVAISKTFISLNIRNRIKQFTPAMLFVIGSLFILRGMNLGVPYLSPSFYKKDCTKHNCCKK